MSRMCLKETRRPLVTVVTAQPQDALGAFDIEATDYLLKPVDDARLDRAINRMRIDL